MLQEQLDFQLDILNIKQMYNSENWKDYSDSLQILMSDPSSYIPRETLKKRLELEYIKNETWIQMLQTLNM